MEYQVSQTLVLPFTSTGLTTGLSSFPDLFILNNGIHVISPSVTYTEIGSGLYTLSYAPYITGEYYVFIQGRLQAEFSVVTKTTKTYLQNLEDEALGSWTWDKTSNLLTLMRQDGTTMATFSMLDTLEAASKERLT
jgi:hypothetical protein